MERLQSKNLFLCTQALDIGTQLGWQGPFRLAAVHHKVLEDSAADVISFVKVPKVRAPHIARNSYH
jgi:hypothetical protein